MNFKLPNDLKVSSKSVGSIISISTIIGIVTAMFSFFKFNKLDIQYRVIILLSIFLLIAIIDIIILYMRDREKQYKISCLNFIIETININIENINHETTELKSILNKNSQDIESLKNKLKLNSKS